METPGLRGAQTPPYISSPSGRMHLRTAERTCEWVRGLRHSSRVLGPMGSQPCMTASMLSSRQAQPRETQPKKEVPPARCRELGKEHMEAHLVVMLSCWRTC